MYILIVKLLILVALADIAFTVLKIIINSIVDAFYMCKAIIKGAPPEEVKRIQQQRSEQRQSSRKAKSLFSVSDRITKQSEKSPTVNKKGKNQNEKKTRH